MATSPHILVVEDDAAQRHLLQRIIHHFFPAAFVTAVPTGYDALAVYQAQGVDLLILDNRLPDVWGSALLHSLRITGVTTPTLLVTGMFSFNQDPTDLHTQYLQKPFTIHDLVATLTGLLSPATLTQAA